MAELQAWLTAQCTPRAAVTDGQPRQVVEVDLLQLSNESPAAADLLLHHPGRTKLQTLRLMA